MLTVAGDWTKFGGAAIDGRSSLDEVAREGARRMLVAALETEVAAYLHAHVTERDADGHALVVRNGRGRTRKVTLGGGTIAVNRASTTGGLAPTASGSRSRAASYRRTFFCSSFVEDELAREWVG